MSTNYMTTPKIIHFLWLNFNHNQDGILDNKLLFFIKRITNLHPSYKIHFVSKWDECISDINLDYKWIIDVLLNPSIGGAHKSDLLRFYYLYTIGGVWVDVSTFIVDPFDELVERNKNGFTCYYVPYKICQSWMIKPLQTLYDLIDIDNYSNISNKICSVLQDKYEKYPFITENYFCISQQYHEIPLKVLEMFKKYYQSFNLSSNENVNNSRNKYMFTMFNDIFDNNTGILKSVDEQLTGIYKTSNDKFLNDIFDGSYLFNYLMMYIVIADYAIAQNFSLHMTLNEKRKNIISKYSNYGNIICKNNACYDLQLKNSDKDDNIIFLLSASYNRLSKWNDNLEKRITWENTIAGDIIFKASSNEEAISSLNKINITQLKFGSWSRNSPVIDKLMKLFTTTQPRSIKDSALNSKKSKESNKISNGSKKSKEMVENKVNNIKDILKI